MYYVGGVVVTFHTEHAGTTDSLGGGQGGTSCPTITYASWNRN